MGSVSFNFIATLERIGSGTNLPQGDNRVNWPK
jgi:hypothetical protein